MSVTQQLMKLGSFSIRLRPDAPSGALQAVAEGDSIIVTPTQLRPIEGFSDANILAAAIYHGVITGEPSATELRGYDAAWWLGTPEGAGYGVSGTTTRTAGTLTQWIGDLTTPAFAAGTVTNTTSHTATYKHLTYRERIDAACRAVGAEWIAQPDLTIDAGPTASLFVTTPTVIITDREEGQEGALRGLEAVEVRFASNIDQMATKVTVIGTGAGQTVNVTSSTGSTTFKDPRNNTAELERLVNAPTEAGTTASAVAASTLAQLNQVRRDVVATSRTSLVRRLVQPGDYVWGYNARTGVTDAANQVNYRGEVLAPMKLRVYGLTWPIEAGMGVYVRRAGATPTYTDLSDYVVHEEPMVRWDVGASPRSTSETNPATTGATAYTPSTAAVAARVATAGGVATYTPAVTATTTNPNLGSTAIAEGEYQVANGRCSGRATVITGGTGITAGSGSYRISLPVAAKFLTSTSVVCVGSGAVYLGNPSPTVNPVALDVSPGASTARLIGPGFEAGSTTGGGGLGLAGNAFWVTFDYPVA